MLFSKVQHDPPKSESPSRPLSAPNTGRPTSASPRRARPTSAGSSAFPTTDGSFSSKIISGKPSCIPLIRARNPIIRTPKVTLYRNGQALDGTGKPFTLSQNMPQILGEITAALQLPFSAKYLFNDKGMPLDKVDLFNDNMDVIVSMGERFKYRTYMDRDEYDSLNRTCKYCNESYTPADNTADSCCHHPLRFLASRWLCCKARERSAPGCHRGFHCDPKIEDDKNVLPTRRCVNAVLNGMPISGPHVVVVDIPSKLEILLENCSRKLRLIPYATQLYTQRGVEIQSLSQITNGMNVVVSTGEKFRWGVYLDREELEKMERKCKRCRRTFTSKENHSEACRFHPMSYSKSLGFWLCCKQRNENGKAPGCKNAPHTDPRFIAPRTPLPSSGY
eukprot:TRINITY_DN1179_c0_g1_i8.p1 TRINITY_DN1179_c0_g1~~TRINITY_DN1179_c0_g1_i8.p1  ORF type:complete len:391 (+),score=50.51 TRINITY_DN1179_c0_g1_i8:178-1350(+)